MPHLVFGPSSFPPLRCGVYRGRLVNVYQDSVGAIRPCCGLSCPYPIKGMYRGGLLIGSLWIAVIGTTLWRIHLDKGRCDQLGTIEGSDPVIIEKNRRIPYPDVVVCTTDRIYIQGQLCPEEYPDARIGVPNSVSYLDAYFIFTYANGKLVASNINTTELDPLSYAYAESATDALLRGVVKERMFIAFGSTTTEIYVNMGSSPFPLIRAEVLSLGIFNAWSVAGHDRGWTQHLYLVASDCTVCRLVGYRFERVSFAPIEEAIAALDSRATLRVFVYNSCGQHWVVVTSKDWTWELNVNTMSWNERSSEGFAAWRAEQSIWTSKGWLVGDRGEEGVLLIQPHARSEGDYPIVCRAEQVLYTFPEQVYIKDVECFFVVGLRAEHKAAACRVEVSWSFDHGVTWGLPISVSLERTPDHSTMVAAFPVNQRTKGSFTLAWEIRDPYPFALLDAFVHTKPIR